MKKKIVLQLTVFSPLWDTMDWIGCGSVYTWSSGTGLDWVSQLVDWVGLDLAKWTHVQLWPSYSRTVEISALACLSFSIEIYLVVWPQVVSTTKTEICVSGGTTRRSTRSGSVLSASLTSTPTTSLNRSGCTSVPEMCIGMGTIGIPWVGPMGMAVTMTISREWEWKWE